MVIYLTYGVLIILWLIIYYRTNLSRNHKIGIGILFLVLPVVVAFAVAMIVGDKPNP